MQPTRQTKEIEVVIIPANIYLTHSQLTVLAELGEDVIVVEQAATPDVVDCWVMGPESEGDKHRSVILEKDGNVINDSVVKEKSEGPPGWGDIVQGLTGGKDDGDEDS